MNGQQKPDFAIFESVLNNITCKMEHQDNQMYLLCKKQKSGHHCQLYVTDFCQNFWIKKITYEYITELKQKLKIKTDLKLFVEHLAQGLKESCRIRSMVPYPVLIVNLRITDGLVINCTIQPKDYHANIETNRQNFSKIMKIFGTQFYEAKQLQYKQALTKISTIKQEMEQKNRQQKTKQVSKTLQNKIFGKQEIPVAQKNRDLINPFRKKRKGQGMKITRLEIQSQEQNESS